MFKTFARERVVPWEGVDGIQVRRPAICSTTPHWSGWLRGKLSAHHGWRGQGHLAESLRRIRKNSSKKLADLHNSCAAALVELEKEIPAAQVQADIRTKIHIIFAPFRLTCDGKNIKVRAAQPARPFPAFSVHSSTRKWFSALRRRSRTLWTASRS